MIDAGNAIDTYIAQLARYLTVADATRDMIVEEARSHLDATVAQLVAAGADQPAAAAQALAAFGPAAQVAARYNAVHPLAWDARRFGLGILWGIGLSWLIWTAITFPFLVQSAAQQHAAFPGGSVEPPGALLFAATPLSFGLMRVMEFDGPLIVLPLLVLFGVVPLLWGWRARRGWQPGLAFGLGVVIGFPWLLPGLVYYWGNSFGFPLDLVLIVVGIWLLCPYAMLMSWFGQRLAMARAGRSAIVTTRVDSRTDIVRYLRDIPYAALGIILVALIAVNIWSWQQAAQLAPPSVAQQLTTAQANLSFALRLPTYLPPHFSLKQVTVATADHIAAGCSQCYVTLEYQRANGDSLTLDEWQFPSNAPQLPPGLAPPAVGYAVQAGSGGEVDHVWWLGIDTKQLHEINVTWMRDSVSYTLWSQSSSQSAFSPDLLKNIAASI